MWCTGGVGRGGLGGKVGAEDSGFVWAVGGLCGFTEVEGFRGLGGGTLGDEGDCAGGFEPVECEVEGLSSSESRSIRFSS